MPVLAMLGGRLIASEVAGAAMARGASAGTAAAFGRGAGFFGARAIQNIGGRAQERAAAIRAPM
jgi:hypothetical protein